MRTVGFISTAAVVVGLGTLATVVAMSARDVQRYLKIRKM
jgi:hypothetical protein